MNKTLFVLFCLIGSGCGRRDQMVQLQPMVYLAWNGINWSILDDRSRTPGLKDAPAGGTTIVESVKSIDVIDSRFIVGRTDSGKWFIFSHSVPEDAVEWFNSESDWITKARSMGINNPALKSPETLAQ